MKKKFWFYFGMGIKNGITVHKNGIVGANTEFCPVIDIENSVMEEDGAEQFHVVNFQEVSHGMFMEFKQKLSDREEAKKAGEECVEEII